VGVLGAREPQREFAKVLHCELRPERGDERPHRTHFKGARVEPTATIAYMLVQHKAQLGVKTIESVILFRDDDEHKNPRMQLLFKIIDQEDPTDPMIIDTRFVHGARASFRKGALRVRRETSGHGENVLRVHELRVHGSDVVQRLRGW